ncbi:hypothetical protein ACQP0C_17280 [Nocardia sp. CA-129566]|uniref:hypothetical protein n=1 Tax=Nocardia sp. CA-129566 TaxID=3239976 RepID=UPI003D9756C0
MKVGSTLRADGAAEQGRTDAYLGTFGHPREFPMTFGRRVGVHGAQCESITALLTVARGPLALGDPDRYAMLAALCLIGAVARLGALAEPGQTSSGGISGRNRGDDDRRITRAR